MALQSHAALAEVRDTLLETYASNDAMNQLILSNLDPRAWRAQPLGQKGSGRTIAAIFANLYSSRLSWLYQSRRLRPSGRRRERRNLRLGSLFHIFPIPDEVGHFHSTANYRPNFYLSNFHEIARLRTRTIAEIVSDLAVKRWGKASPASRRPNQSNAIIHASLLGGLNPAICGLNRES